MSKDLVPSSYPDAVPATIDVDQLPPETAAAAITRSEIDIQVSTARRYPRSLKKFRDMAVQMATIDEDTAASCFYMLPRGEKTIEGPSVRLAEIVAVSWTNLRHGGRIIEENDRFIVAQGMAHDMEANVMSSVEVRRRITDSKGRRYSDDMIAVTAQAAIAIATRNAIFKVVPRAFVDQIYAVARRAAKGEEKTLGVRRQAALDYFAKEQGVTKDKVFARLSTPEKKVAGIEDIGLAELEMLQGLRQAIKDGETNAHEAFSPQPDAGAETKKVDQFVAAEKAKDAVAKTVEAEFEPAAKKEK